MKIRFLSLYVMSAVFVAIVAAPSASALCAVNSPYFSTGYRGDTVGATEADLNDYGRIAYDADGAYTNPEECAGPAYWALKAKLENTLAVRSDGSYVNPKAFRRWLDGYNVALVFAAAQRLGKHRYGTQELHNLLERVKNRYSQGPNPEGPCVDGSTNSCTDEWAGDAAAYGWMTAYYSRRMASATGIATMHRHTSDKISAAFRSVCLFNKTKFENSDRRVLCNGTVEELQLGTAETMSLDHGYQNIPYGFGLMTSVASAFIGLDASGQGYVWKTGEKDIAYALFEEAQRKVSSWSAFKKDCARPARLSDGTWTFFYNADCGDGPQYTPDMFALYNFYIRKVGRVPYLSFYDSSYFNDTRFSLSDARQNDAYASFRNYGRFFTYGMLGFQWVSKRTSGTTDYFMPYDRYNPIGYFEGVSSTGRAQGWACDQDIASGKIQVRISDLNNVNTTVVYAEAQDASETAINNLCNGGSMHRFWVQLPSWSKGMSLRAQAADYTFYGVSDLPCLQEGGCRW